MLLRVSHRTRYTYSQPIRLGPQRLRLRPRCDGSVAVQHHALRIEPLPAGRSDILDEAGNVVTCVWFAKETAWLRVDSDFEVRTLRTDPYDYLPEETPLSRPYTPKLQRLLHPYLHPSRYAEAVCDLARTLRAGAQTAHQFAQRINGHLHQHLQYEMRISGQPHSPAETLRRGRGACRDLAVLFIALCRSQGIAARFVSGYQKGQDTGQDEGQARYMHAWAEIYLPGGGWRGFDPTHGVVVADAHVAVAAAADPAGAAPIEGGYHGTADCVLEAEIHIHAPP